MEFLVGGGRVPNKKRNETYVKTSKKYAAKNSSRKYATNYYQPLTAAPSRVRPTQL